MIAGSRQASRSSDLIRRYAGGGVRRIAETAGITVVAGRGSHLIDDHGRSYLDFVAGYGVAGLGHQHPQLVEAIAEQAQNLTVSPFHNPALATYLERLAQVLPAGLTQTALFSGGAEAVEAALRLTRAASGRIGVLAFDSAFHGKTVGVRFAGGAHESERRKLGVSWVCHAEFPVCHQHSIRYEDCDEWSLVGEGLAARDDLDDVGAVIVEPVLGTAGNVPPRRHFLAELRQVCDERGWLLVFDESQTGFGRTGEVFAADLFDVIPDVLVLGKVMGGGFPLSGVAAAPELWAASSLDRPSSTSSSYGGNPLACAAGTAVLEVVSQADFLAQANRVGLLLREGLRELAATSPYVSWPRGVGMMLGFDLVDPETGALAEEQYCGRVFRACRENGLLLAADVPRVRISPPLTLSEAEAERALAILGEALR